MGLNYSAARERQALNDHYPDFLRILANLFEVGNIKVQKDDLTSMGDLSVAFADGSGYLATVDVFHQLHCLVCLERNLQSLEI